MQEPVARVPNVRPRLLSRRHLHRAANHAPASTDRRPVDPPPIIDLRIYEGDEGSQLDVTFTYRANFCLFASLENARPMAQGRLAQAPPNQMALAGTNVAGMSYLDRPNPAGYFIFPDLSVRHEGRYRLKFTLFEETKDSKDMDATDPSAASDAQTPADAFFAARFEVRSVPFQVYSAKKFPGLAESTALSRIVADQGCRVRIRRDVRMRRREPKNNKDWDEFEEDSALEHKRTASPDASSQVGRAASLPGRESTGGNRSRSMSHSSNVSYHAPAQRRYSNQDMPHHYPQAFAPPPMSAQQMPPPSMAPTQMAPPLMSTNGYPPQSPYEPQSQSQYGGYMGPQPVAQSSPFQHQQHQQHQTAYQYQPPPPPSQQQQQQHLPPPPPTYSYMPNQHMPPPVYDQFPQMRHEQHAQYIPLHSTPQAYTGYGREPAPSQYGNYSQSPSHPQGADNVYGRGSQSSSMRPTTPSMTPVAGSIAPGQPLPPLRTLDHAPVKMESPASSNSGRSQSYIPGPYEGHYNQYGLPPPPPPPPQYMSSASTINGTAPKRSYGTVFDTQHVNQPLRSGARPSNPGAENGSTSADEAASDDDGAEVLKMRYRRADGTEILRTWPLRG